MCVWHKYISTELMGDNSINLVLMRPLQESTPYKILLKVGNCFE